jgi:glyoxylase-like metal-dependent hydrolase (beta-lactamase superfamily II)
MRSSLRDVSTGGPDYPWATPPEGGRALDVAPGVKWLRMPLPFQLDHVNLWLLEDGPGWTVVDTGIGLPPTRALWERVFASELEGRPIGRVVVTHFHPDHMGNAAWLGERWGVELSCALAEWLMSQVAWQGFGGNDAQLRIDHYRRHGVGEHALEQFRQRGNHYRAVVPTVTHRFRCLREGDVLAIGGRSWRVFTTLGHAPEHACLHCAETDVLISGDQVLPKITTNVSVWPDQPNGDPLRLYLDSLGRFEPLAADTLVLPSHGLPFRGLHDRLEFLRQHHAARLAEVAGALREPRTAAELVPVLFHRALDTHQLGFAIGEVLAHLNFLESHGDAARVTDADGVHRFTKA